jgi:putative RecB family exonuclease
MNPIVMEPPALSPAAVPERPPNLRAEHLTGRPYLSHSQLSLMRSCPRKFAFTYVENAPRDFIPGSLIFGGSIHSALEHYFRARLEGLELTAAELLNAFKDAWQRQKEQAGDQVPVRFNKTDSEETLHGLAQRMIAAFLASPLAHPKGIILGVEEELRVVLDPDLPDVLAKVDLVTHTEGALHVVDWKTSRSRWNEQKALESGEQLLLYGQTVTKLSHALGLPVKLHFGIITKAKTVIVQILPVPTDPGRVAGMKASVASVWEAIQAGNFYPSPSPMNCTTCPFRSRCPAMS